MLTIFKILKKLVDTCLERLHQKLYSIPNSPRQFNQDDDVSLDDVSLEHKEEEKEYDEEEHEEDPFEDDDLEIDHSTPRDGLFNTSKIIKRIERNLDYDNTVRQHLHFATAKRDELVAQKRILLTSQDKDLPSTKSRIELIDKDLRPLCQIIDRAIEEEIQKALRKYKSITTAEDLSFLTNFIVGLFPIYSQATQEFRIPKDYVVPFKYRRHLKMSHIALTRDVIEMLFQTVKFWGVNEDLEKSGRMQYLIWLSCPEKATIDKFINRLNQKKRDNSSDDQGNKLLSELLVLTKPFNFLIPFAQVLESLKNIKKHIKYSDDLMLDNVIDCRNPEKKKNETLAKNKANLKKANDIALNIETEFKGANEAHKAFLEREKRIYTNIQNFILKREFKKAERLINELKKMVEVRDNHKNKVRELLDELSQLEETTTKQNQDEKNMKSRQLRYDEKVKEEQKNKEEEVKIEAEKHIEKLKELAAQQREMEARIEKRNERRLAREKKSQLEKENAKDVDETKNDNSSKQESKHGKEILITIDENDLREYTRELRDNTEFTHSKPDSLSKSDPRDSKTDSKSDTKESSSHQNAYTAPQQYRPRMQRRERSHTLSHYFDMQKLRCADELRGLEDILSALTTEIKTQSESFNILARSAILGVAARAMECLKKANLSDDMRYIATHFRDVVFHGFDQKFFAKLNQDNKECAEVNQAILDMASRLMTFLRSPDLPKFKNKEAILKGINSPLFSEIIGHQIKEPDATVCKNQIELGNHELEQYRIAYAELQKQPSLKEGSHHIPTLLYQAAVGFSEARIGTYSKIMQRQARKQPKSDFHVMFHELKESMRLKYFMAQGRGFRHVSSNIQTFANSRL